MPKGTEQVNTQRTLTKCRRIRLHLAGPTPTHGPDSNSQTAAEHNNERSREGHRTRGGSKVVNTCQLWHS